MANDQVSGTGTSSGSAPMARPPWLVPVALVIVVGAVVLGGRKNRDVVENPLVDLSILTVGVFAFAAAFRFIATKAGSPGLASFFGGQVTKS